LVFLLLVFFLGQLGFLGAIGLIVWGITNSIVLFAAIMTILGSLLVMFSLYVVKPKALERIDEYVWRIQPLRMPVAFILGFGGAALGGIVTLIAPFFFLWSTRAPEGSVYVSTGTGTSLYVLPFVLAAPLIGILTTIWLFRRFSQYLENHTNGKAYTEIMVTTAVLSFISIVMLLIIILFVH
jgi:hypothetical protein